MFNSFRYQELLRKQDKPYLVLADHLWTVYQRMVIPVGPINQDYSVSIKDTQCLLKYFKKAVLVRTTRGFLDSPKEWYCIISDKYVDMEEMSGNVRSKIKRGLKNCLIKEINMKIMKQEGWSVFSSAFKRYKNTRLTMTEAQFHKDIIIDGFDDIIHYWGVFEKESGKLIGYVQNFLYNKIEVKCGDIRFHPDYLRLYSSYALFYEMSRYYLVKNKFSFVNNGFRNLLHETNMQDFLVDRLHFRKQAVGLRVYYRPLIKCLLSLAYPFRHILGKCYPTLAAVYKMDAIIESFNNKHSLENRL